MAVAAAARPKRASVDDHLTIAVDENRAFRWPRTIEIRDGEEVRQLSYVGPATKQIVPRVRSRRSEIHSGR